MSWTNYHSHSHYCDGKEAPETHIQAAIQKDFLAFGCSSHASVPFDAFWCMKKDDQEKYRQEILDLKEKYKEEIEIYLSLEVDYIPHMIGPAAAKAEMGLDYTVGSVHFVDQLGTGTPWGIDGTLKEFELGLKEIFHQDIEAAVSRYFELTRQMLTEDCPEVLGHMDKVKMHNKKGNFFDENADWYREQVMASLETARSTGVIIEVNTRGVYKKKTDTPYPSPWILKEIYDMGIPIMLNSDSHHPDEIDKGFTTYSQLLASIGFKQLRILYEGEWQDRPFTAKGFQK